jgi:CMP-N-acetylneuraminic acid synthetase
MGNNGIIAIIPAKGGSTRLKRKNIAEICGQPLISYQIDNAKNSAICDKIIVSTEDDEIASVARKYGADTPFLRPLELARDPATVSDVCLHALDQIDPQGESYDTLLVLLPTAPLCSHEDIINAHHVFTKNKALFLMSVTESDSPPFNALRYHQDGKSLISCFPDSEFRHTKSTECPKTFHSNGAIVIVNIPAFKKNGSLWGNPILAYEMPPGRSIDIDTKFDLELARFHMASKKKNMNPGEY